jgi:poly-gamma-glutamate capsule biosynthesis protein CapA/YwtB (metallophosphatase superfamily)
VTIHITSKKDKEKTERYVVGHDPVAATFLMLNPRAALPLPLPIRIIVRSVGWLADVLGFWRSPRLMEGNFETMTSTDKLYWIYKSAQPVRHAERGSSVEAHFQNQAQASIDLPQGFTKIDEVRIAAVGDLMENRLIANSSSVMYENIAGELFAADLSFANLELPMTRQAGREFVVDRRKTPSLHISDEQFDVLKGHRGKNFTALSTATNHIWDFEEEGVLTTLDRLAAESIAAAGTNLTPEDQRKATLLNIGSLKIGLIAMTFGQNRSMRPEQQYRVNQVRLNGLSADIDLSLPQTQIRYCQDCGCDFIIGSLHWGLEYEYFPAARQLETAHELAEAGIDLIIGHHPHIVQPVEYYRTRRDPDRTVVIAYSLGNLVSPCSDAHLALSFLLQVNLAKGTLRGKIKTYPQSCRMIPVCQQAFMHLDKPALRIVKVTDLSRFCLPFILPC